MTPAKGSIGRYLDRPDPAIRFYLFFGPDEAQSRALAERLRKSLDAEKVVLAAPAIKSDPALLADEAAAISMFGGKRLVWVEPAADDVVAGVEALLQSPPPESPVLAIAGDLKKSSALRKLAEGHKTALAQISYMPDADGAERIVEDLARTEGLILGPGAAARIASACANDRAVIAQELVKLATYLDATPALPRELDGRALDEVGADLPESGFMNLADLALSGDLAGLAEELASVSSSGAEAIPVVRSLQRRLLMIAPLRARVDSGEQPGAVMASMDKSFFWKDKPMIARLLGAWDSAGLGRVAARVGKVERDLMLTAAPPAEALGEELTAIARAVRRR